MISLLQSVGLAKKLKRNNPELIRKNLVKKDIAMFLEEVREKISDSKIKAVLSDRLEMLSQEIQNKYSLLQEKMSEYSQMKNDPTRRNDVILIRIEIKKLKKEFKIGWKSWIQLIRHLERDHKIQPHHEH